MKQKTTDTLIKTYNESFSKMYVLSSVISLLKEFCSEKEEKAIYYGLKQEGASKLSDERNHCINLLSVVSDNISEIMSLLIAMEKEFTLNHNTYNSRR